MKKMQKPKQNPVSSEELAAPRPTGSAGNGVFILEWLRRHPLPQHARRTASEIDRDIREMRESWDDKGESE